MAQALLRCADYRLNDTLAKKFSDATILSDLGGIKWYLSRDGGEELFEKIEFLVEQSAIKNLVLVSHTDCDLYKELGEDDVDRYAEDLRNATGQIQERLPELSVTSYLYDVEEKTLKKIALDE